MDQARSAVSLGLLACGALVVLSALPYFVAPTAAVGVYYAVGVAGPPLIALFAVVVAIVLAAGRRGRTDPSLAAGIALAIGAFVGLLSLAWASAVTPSLVGGLAEQSWLAYHRWALATVGLLVPVSAGWYARSVL